MFNVIRSRLFQGYRTGSFPHSPPMLPERFKGVPHVDSAQCVNCSKCVQACPVSALECAPGGKRVLDLGKCLFCGKCEKACGGGALKMTSEYRTAAFSREDLKMDPCMEFVPREYDNDRIQSLIGRSLKIRQVSAGGCNACELDFNVLNTLAWDMGRFGIQPVASPRHADAVLVTGPVTKNMLLGLQKTFQAMPKPRCVIACGTCSISGGIYAEGSECCSGVESVLKVDLFIPGCPPHPATILDALLRFMGALPD